MNRRKEMIKTKTVYDLMKEQDSERLKADFLEKQKQDYDFKVAYAENRAKAFVKECEKRGLNYHVSVGGLDSITLLLFLRSIGIDCPAISASHLEDASIQKIHRELGVESVKPIKREDGTYWTKAKVLQEFGFPVLSKEIASKIETLANPTEKNKTVRHAIITGETGEYGGFQKNSRMKMSRKWLEKFGGYANEEEGTDYQNAPFKVSAKCCYYLKEKPCDIWAKEHKSVPFLGLMASEGGRRQKSLMLHGCNYFGKSTIRSAPFAIFSRQDLLQLALDLAIPVPEIYGTIERRKDGTLYTTKAQRTGCAMCGFGIHLEKRPHRFDQLLERNRRSWDYWMYNCCTDDYGNQYGWAKVLDYIGVRYEVPETRETQKEKSPAEAVTSNKGTNK